MVNIRTLFLTDHQIEDLTARIVSACKTMNDKKAVGDHICISIADYLYTLVQEHYNRTKIAGPNNCPFPIENQNRQDHYADEVVVWHQYASFLDEDWMVIRLPLRVSAIS